MNPPKVNEYDYINFLIATQKAYSCTEAERVQPESGKLPAHDAITGSDMEVVARLKSLLALHCSHE